MYDKIMHQSPLHQEHLVLQNFGIVTVGRSRKHAVTLLIADDWIGRTVERYGKGEERLVTVAVVKNANVITISENRTVTAVP